MAANDHLSPHLFHGTARPVEGDKILPAKVHGKGSYWGDTGSTRNEPAQEHAWAHPDEHKAWEFALDRVNFHYAEEGAEVGPRARVYAVKPNEHQTPGHDSSIPGEIKAPHFDIAHPVDTKPGHQGTFPGINWNEHVAGGSYRLPGDEDANHPSHLSVQFGHREGVHDDKEAITGRLQGAAHAEGMERAVARARAVAGPLRGGEYGKDTPLPLRKQL